MTQSLRKAVQGLRVPEGLCFQQQQHDGYPIPNSLPPNISILDITLPAAAIQKVTKSLQTLLTRCPRFKHLRV